jgi:hypothetical protein
MFLGFIPVEFKEMAQVDFDPRAFEEPSRVCQAKAYSRFSTQTCRQSQPSPPPRNPTRLTLPLADPPSSNLPLAAANSLRP